MSEEPTLGRDLPPPELPAPPPDPSAFRLRGDPPRVVRLSRRALITLGSVSAIAVGGALIYALAPEHGRKAATELYNTDGHNTSDKLASMPKDYGDVPKLGPPLPGDLGRPIVAAQNQGKIIPPPGMGASTGAGSTGNAEANAAAQARQRAAQVREAARQSKLFATTAEAQNAQPGTAIASAAPTPTTSPTNLGDVGDPNVDAIIAVAAYTPAKGEKKLGSLKALEKLITLHRNATEAAAMMAPLFGIYDLRLADAHLGSSMIASAKTRASIVDTDPMIVQGRQLIQAFVDTIRTIADVLA